ncbi:MAG TPA: phenylalanine--tRNA ligase subunit beta [Longimicrobiales bacterium]|jgi:phenylalanyl-tRNA synthetase beta chain
MDISYRWLRALAPGLELDIEALAARLADRGAAVDGIRHLADGLTDIVVGRVDAVEAHPNADRLSLCTVDAGGGERLRVVCGAPNVTEGVCYPFAPVGASLPGGVAIREVKIRGEVSRGMLCSAKELGLGTDHTGILELPGEPTPGAPFVDAFGLDDWRLDVEVTANRGDLLSHQGVAREVAPGGVAGVRLPDIPGASAADLDFVRGEREARVEGATVRVEDPDLCSRYLGAVLRGVKVGPSPAWLQARLRAAGSRPINNVVDATNYVLLELGQPLHAFDLGCLAEGTIVVRRAGAGESTFTTLDGEERRLHPDMLMICDLNGPVAVAGVMGGQDSEVTEDTADVLLECAMFEPRSVRATRRGLGLSTDASYRFERGVDPAGMELALRRAVEVILAVAGGAVQGQVADCLPRPWEPATVRLRVSRVERVLGVRVAPPEIRSLLEPLGFELEEAGEDAIDVAIPGWRSYDVTREVDLIEEIARTRGYDTFPETLGPFRPGTVPDHPLFQLEDRLRTLLSERGLFECQTPAFVPARQGDVRVLNPVSREEDHLRREVLPSLVRRVEHNWARGVRDVRLFEIATSFAAAGSGEPPVEETRLALVIAGQGAPTHWSAEPRELDLWDLRGLADAVLARGALHAVLEPGAPEGKGLVRSEGFTIRGPSGEVSGWAGRVMEGAMDAPPWAGAVWGLELGLPEEPDVMDQRGFEPMPAFPGVERDLALLVPRAVAAARVAEALRGAGGDLLAEVGLFDKYEGSGVPIGLRSLAYRLRFQSSVRTLTDEEVDGAVNGILKHLESELGVHVRG